MLFACFYRNSARFLRVREGDELKREDEGAFPRAYSLSNLKFSANTDILFLNGIYQETCSKLT